MKIENNKIKYRRANIDDIETLIDFRVRFLNEMCKHPDDDEAKSLKKSMREYFSEAMPVNNFIAWLAEYNGKTIGISGLTVWRRPPKYGGLASGRLGYIMNMYTPVIVATILVT